MPAGVRVARVSPGLRFLFDGAWFLATLAWFAVYLARMRPATAAGARVTPALPEIR